MSTPVPDPDLSANELKRKPEDGFAGATSAPTSNPNSKRLKASPGSQESGDTPSFLDELIAEEQEQQGGGSAELGRGLHKRPLVPQIDPEQDSLAFQWMDIDMYAGDPLRENPCVGEVVPGSSDKPVPIVRLYGVTELGNSVLAHVHGFTPYF